MLHGEGTPGTPAPALGSCPSGPPQLGPSGPLQGHALWGHHGWDPQNPSRVLLYGATMAGTPMDILGSCPTEPCLGPRWLLDLCGTEVLALMSPVPIIQQSWC